MIPLDINVDMGESYGRFKVGSDESLMPHIQSCNLACGFHGGDPSTIRRTIDLALENNVKIGAHPSYPDLSGFGRRSMELDMRDLEDILLYQIMAVKGLVEVAGGTLHHVKPHGALNNDMMKSDRVLQTILAIVQKINPNLYTYVPYKPDLDLPRVKWEVFADRTYERDYTLTPRKIKGSLITDADTAKAHLGPIFFDSRIETADGVIDVQFDTICVHGDNPRALEIIKVIQALQEQRD